MQEPYEIHIQTTDFDKCRYAQFSQPVDCGRAGYMGTWHAELCTLVHGPETCYCCEIHADQNCDIFGHRFKFFCSVLRSFFHFEELHLPS